MRPAEIRSNRWNRIEVTRHEANDVAEKSESQKLEQANIHIYTTLTVNQNNNNNQTQAEPVEPNGSAPWSMKSAAKTTMKCAKNAGVRMCIF